MRAVLRSGAWARDAFFGVVVVVEAEALRGERPRAWVGRGVVGVGVVGVDADCGLGGEGGGSGPVYGVGVGGEWLLLRRAGCRLASRRRGGKSNRVSEGEGVGSSLIQPFPSAL